MACPPHILFENKAPPLSVPKTNTQVARLKIFTLFVRFYYPLFIVYAIILIVPKGGAHYENRISRHQD